MLPLLEEASSRPLTTFTQDVLYCRDKPADLYKVTRKDTSLKEEHNVVTDLSIGLNMSKEHRRPVLAASFLARRLCASQTMDSAESVKKGMTELKDIHSPKGWKTRTPTTDALPPTGYMKPPARGCGPFSICWPRHFLLCFETHP